VTIPRYGSGTLDVEGISTLSDLLRQLPELRSGATFNGLQYKLQGKLTLQGSDRRIPFDYLRKDGNTEFERALNAHAALLSV
jgi:hypothetical protein